MSAADATAGRDPGRTEPVRFKNSLPGGKLTEKELNAKGKRLLEELKASKFKIIHETFRDGNWELVIRNADGSNPENITRTPAVHELFPHASPDGKRVVFLADMGEGKERTRHAYMMDVDGTGRVKVGENGRQPFWSSDGKRIGFSRDTRVNCRREAENKGLYFYHIETGQYSQHPRKDIACLVNPCCSPDGKWIVTSAMGGMGFNHSIVAIEADGTRAVELRRSVFEKPKAVQCRPDVSPNGRQIAWGIETGPDMAEWVEIGDIDLTKTEPRVTNRRYIVGVPFPLQTYHVDWSPDGKYIAYSEGGRGTRMEPAGFFVGMKAAGWDIWVVKPSEPEVVVRLTFDGLSNKEPDWVTAE
jgi:Tol biopolymer transport system component